MASDVLRYLRASRRATIIPPRISGAQRSRRRQIVQRASRKPHHACPSGAAGIFAPRKKASDQPMRWLAWDRGGFPAVLFRRHCWTSHVPWVKPQGLSREACAATHGEISYLCAALLLMESLGFMSLDGDGMLGRHVRGLYTAMAASELRTQGGEWRLDHRRRSRRNGCQAEQEACRLYESGAGEVQVVEAAPAARLRASTRPTSRPNWPAARKNIPADKARLYRL